MWRRALTLRASAVVDMTRTNPTARAIQAHAKANNLPASCMSMGYPPARFQIAGRKFQASPRVLPLKDNVRTARFPIVTVLLIVLNFAAFVWELTLPTDEASNIGFERAGVSKRDEALATYGVIPYRLTHPGEDCGITGHGGSFDQDRLPGHRRRPRRSAGNVTMLDAPAWWVTIFTAMFLHAGWFHIIGNVLFLWIFGNNVEDSIGRLRYLLFYVLAGIAATYALTLFTPDSAEVLFGASGAVAGVLGGYILRIPERGC